MQQLYKSFQIINFTFKAIKFIIKMNVQNEDVHLALLMMVKNEHKRLHVSLNSVLGHVNSVVMFDTGSTDNTIEIAQNFCRENNIPLHLKQGEFVDFSTSRNVSLAFADEFPEIDYLLLMDTNDELKGGQELRKFCIENKNISSTGFLVCQEWFSGQYDKYFNMRLVKAHEGWRYRGVVHEYLCNTKYEKGQEPPVAKVPDNIILYQDRTQDDDKTGKRFHRDKELLLREHKNDPTEPRTCFYLAQTCACLAHVEDAYYYYKLRTGLEGFDEERFQAYLRCGELSEKLNHSWTDSMGWYIKAFEYMPRVEPILAVAEHYRKTNNWILSFTFANLCCNLKYPEHAILFVDKFAYTYKRWHILGIVAFYVQQYQVGKDACLKAIEHGLNADLDRSNLTFYEERLSQIDEINKVKKEEEVNKMVKKDFISFHMQKLSTENPNMNEKQKLQKATLLWKLKKKK
jgi:glycosyltransferase involved in cell wall biosynthesis